MTDLYPRCSAAGCAASFDIRTRHTSTGHEMKAAQPPATLASVKRCAKSVSRYLAAASRNVSKRPYREVA